jgi:hypothetical protein
MNRTFDDGNPAEPSQTVEAAVPGGRQNWVKPALERLPLNEALGANPSLSNDASSSAGS